MLTGPELDTLEELPSAAVALQAEVQVLHVRILATQGQALLPLDVA